MQDLYPQAPELLFMQGWMMGISPWYFNVTDDQLAKQYLKLAYKYNRDNLLYKWALSEELALTSKEQLVLEDLILERIEEFCVDYWPIKEYFRNIIGRKI